MRRPYDDDPPAATQTDDELERRDQSRLASAALDRLTHHAQVIIILGESYRQASRRKEAINTALSTSSDAG